MNNITFTASPMSKPDDLSLKASLAWDYFFNNGWFCVDTGDGGIIVTDEARNLNDAFVLPDYSSLQEWLESYSADKLAEDPAEYFRACGVVPDDLLYEAVEVPVPHGRLIDLDALYRDAERRMRGEESMSEPEISLHMDVLRFCFEKDGSRLYAPTVIESEETP